MENKRTSVVSQEDLNAAIWANAYRTEEVYDTLNEEVPDGNFR